MAHKLLLADDSVTIQRVIELTFADEDVQVIAVGDGRAAIAQLERDRPDIVLADVGMPERDGYEVASFIKGSPELAHIPVLLLTGAFEPIDEARAKAVGCDGVLVKPFEPQMVISRVKDLLAGRKAAGAWAPGAGSAPTRQMPPIAGFDLETSRAQETPAVATSTGTASLEDYFDRLDAAFASLEGGHDGTPSPAVHAARPQPEFTPTPTQDIGSPFDAHDDLAGWDPDLAGDPARPAPAAVADPPAAAPAPPPMPAPTAQPSVYAAPAPVASEPQAPEPPVPAPPPAAGPQMTATPQTTAAQTAAPQPASQAAAPQPSLAEAFALLLSAEQGQQYSPSTSAAPAAAVSEQVIEDIVSRVIARMGDQSMRSAVLEAAERLVREEIARLKTDR
jgi:CheY-like chemotaxis protein